MKNKGFFNPFQQLEMISGWLYTFLDKETNI